MKQFDLEKAKAGAPLVTRDGRPVKFIAHVPEAVEPGRLVVLINGTPCAVRETGAASYSTSYDLFLADPPKVKKSYWVSIGRQFGTKTITSDSGETQEIAEKYWKAPGKTLIGSVEIHWEEEAP